MDARKRLRWGCRVHPGPPPAALILARRAQWGPVVVTGISLDHSPVLSGTVDELQWGPVVVTGIREAFAPPVFLEFVRLQWGPVVVTGIS